MVKSGAYCDAPLPCRTAKFWPIVWLVWGGKLPSVGYVSRVTQTNLSRKLDEFLEPHGFERHGRTWVRSRPLFSDVIDVQRGASIGGVTINIALMHTPTYELVWGKSPTQPFSEPDCIVRTRLGFLVNGRDHWWKSIIQSDVANMMEALSSAAIPFFQSLRA
ncbi:DUF4304 domain-containing protein [Croceicoccus ponticola]